MGRTEKKILGNNAAKIINILKKSYCDEVQIFHYFWYVGLNMEGIGLLTYAAALETKDTGELIHAELLAARISELGEREIRNPAESTKYSTIRPLDPAKHLTVRAAERSMQFEDKAVENYNNLAKKALELGDYVTHNLATTILTDEVKDEQHTVDILKLLEVK